MRRRARVLLAVVLAGSLGASAPAALGQPVPSAKPKAAEGPKDKDKAKKGDKPAADAGAPADAGAAPAGHDGLPAGHPQVDQGLPAGHPQVDQGLPAGHPQVGGGDEDDSDDDEAPPPNPHGGAGQAPPGVFQPPADAAQDDAAIPVGSIVVHIRDAQDKPIPRARLTFEILHSSVAKGDSTDSRDAEADTDGKARFDGLETGSEVRYGITTARGPAIYGITPFQLNDRVGKRALLHSYDVTSNIDAADVRMITVVQLSLREDSIQVVQQIIVGDLSPVSWVADAPFALPAGFKAFNKQEATSQARVDEVKDKGAALRGTFAPGRHDLEFHYQVPLTKDPTQTLKLELPPHVMVATVAGELGKTMDLKVRGLPEAKPRRSDGKRFLVTEWQMKRADDSLPNLEITLTGLPTQGWGRVIAVVLAILAIVLGVVYLEQKRDAGVMDPDAREDLLEAREALLSEIVALERAHKSGDIGPKYYARARAALLDALARIIDMLDAGKAERKKRRRAAEPST